MPEVRDVHTQHLDSRTVNQVVNQSADIEAQDSQNIPTPINQRSKIRLFLQSYILHPLIAYFAKWRGAKEQSPPTLSLEKALLAITGTCLSLGLISTLHYKLLDPLDFPLMQGSFGASAVLLFAAPERLFLVKNILK